MILDKDKKHIIWGTYDKDKPRVKILIEALKQRSLDCEEINREVWHGIKDKSQIGFKKIIFVLFRMILAYPNLVLELLKKEKGSIIIVPYFGMLDIFIIYPFAKIKKSEVHWDVFISIFDTMVNDRKTVKKGSILSKIIYYFEWSAARLCDYYFLDTRSHENYFNNLYNTNNSYYIPVGVDTSNFNRNNIMTKNKKRENRFFNILFYGQFIPLHGIDVILDAMKIIENEDIVLTLIGQGQLSNHIDHRIKNENINNINRIKWVSYEDLPKIIANSDLCLGIFGTSHKAKNVIPNKIYQIMAMGKPFITLKTPAINELKIKQNDYIKLLEKSDSVELKNSIINIKEKIELNNSEELHLHTPIIGPSEILNHLD